MTYFGNASVWPEKCNSLINAGTLRGATALSALMLGLVVTVCTWSEPAIAKFPTESAAPSVVENVAVVDVPAHSERPYGGPQLLSRILFGFINKFSIGAPQQICEKRQCARDECEHYSSGSDKAVKNPLPRRTVIMWITLMLSPVLSFLGCKCIVDNNRRIVGGLLLCASILVASFGVGLYMSTVFRGTWGWWI
jgi:hypothetical protein